MAWRCTGTSNAQLVKNMKEARIIQSDDVFHALCQVDRKFYATSPYSDSPQSIGFNATISAPHMHAYALEYLKVSNADRVLDVGCGSGYLTAAFAKLTERKVTAIDHIEGLVDLTKENIKKGNPEVYDHVEFICGDGRKGYVKNCPYDVIHVGASADSIPQDLIDQLAEGGRMLVPVGTFSQELRLITKEKGIIKSKKLMPVRYVPLTDKESQCLDTDT
eukprot:NODE_714_length_4847_cov_0.370893.p2 type:complete len:219 gc:universal NODE_714_length_4847_cov_0.370893:2221-2877(+)